MKSTLPFAILLAAALSGCSIQEQILTAIGAPPRGFVTDAVFPDDPPAPAMPAHPAVIRMSRPANPCASRSCTPDEGFCAARGYVPDTDGFHRCIASITEHRAATAQ